MVWSDLVLTQLSVFYHGRGPTKTQELSENQVRPKGKRRRINHDFTKLQYAENITHMQKDLIRDMVFLSKKFPGTQQVRLLIGHALFGAGIQYGMPLFWTISPSSRHSGLCMRLSRYLKVDSNRMSVD